VNQLGTVSERRSSASPDSSHVPDSLRLGRDAVALPSLSLSSTAKFARYAAVFLISLAILTAGLASDHTPGLDEHLYISAAQAFLSGAPSTNIEHPPFAKYLIALSIKIFGDTSLGHGFSSGLAGALIALSGFGLTLRLTSSLHSACIAWVLLLANGFLFVESRSANLIVFQVAFEVAGLWAFLVATEENSSRWFAWSGVLLGLSVACRWSGWPALAVCLAYLLFQHRRITRSLLLVAGSSLAVYIVSWVPLLICEHRGLSYLYSANRYILVSHAHYRDAMIDSRPLDPWWASILRFQQQESIHQLIGNPVIASLGLIALIALLWQRKPLLPALYTLHILQWMMVHNLPQYYYYYFDSFTWLTIALAVAMCGISFKRVQLDLAVTACALGSALWPLYAALRY
jgi:dolichyl-phosphate-mannose-protein mannosyltransferase